MNITLSSRRSGEAAGAAAGLTALGAEARAAPQSPQKRLSGGLSLPHAAQLQGSGVPQSPQNFLFGSTAAPQRGHVMTNRP
jgi:hypothetical protein